ncbi:MAG TPA: transglycosylase domain-containing protein [bacterium]|nr:transglycosylase domain-containing protein [bacterium]
MKKAVILSLLGFLVVSFVTMAGVAYLYHHPEVILSQATEWEKAVMARLAEEQEECEGQERDAFADAVAEALVKLEDRSYWSRRTSFSFRSLARAIVANIHAIRFVEGGSAIPQQIVGLITDQAEGHRIRHTLRFKLVQFILASKAWRAFDRTIIMNAYLDALPCGHPAATGATACSAYLFGERRSLDDPYMRLKAYIVASQIRAPYLYQRDLTKLGFRVGKAFGFTDPIFIPRLKRDLLMASLYGSGVCSRNDRSFLTEVVRHSISRAIIDVAPVVRAKEEHVMVIGAAIVGEEVVDLTRGFGGYAFPAGSWAKVSLLRALEKIDRLAFAQIYLPTSRMRVWDLQFREWDPHSVGNIDAPDTSLIHAIAVSHNSNALSFFFLPVWDKMIIPYLDKFLTAKEISRYSTDRDRAYAIRMLSDLHGFPFDQFPDALVGYDDLAYRKLLLGTTRLVKRTMESDIPGIAVPDNAPSIVLGADVKARPIDWVKGLKRQFFREGDRCSMTDTGEMIADAMRKAGTLHALLGKLDIAAPGKTGTTEFTAQAVIGLCVEDPSNEKISPLLVVFWAFHPDWRPLKKLQGAHLQPLLERALRDISQAAQLYEP